MAKRKLESAAMKKMYSKKRTLVNSAKAFPCSDCDGVFHEYSMELYSREEEAKLPASVINESYESIKSKIKDCSPVCKNCMAMRESELFQWMRMCAIHDKWCWHDDNGIAGDFCQKCKDKEEASKN